MWEGRSHNCSEREVVVRFPSRKRTVALLGIGATLVVLELVARPVSRAIRAVSERRRQSALARQLLTAEDAELRRAAARKLAHGELPASHEVQVFVDGAYVTMQVSDTLSRASGDDVIRSFLKALSGDPDSEVRLCAAQGLTFCQAGRRNVSEALRIAMNDTGLPSEVRGAAAAALAGGNGGIEAIEVVAQKLEGETDQDILVYLIQGLEHSGWMLGPTKGHEDRQALSDRLFQRVLHLARESSYESVRGQAFSALTFYEPHTPPANRKATIRDLARQVIRERERYRRVRRAAVFVIGDCEDQPGATELLTELAESDPDQSVRDAASTMLAKLRDRGSDL